MDEWQGETNVRKDPGSHQWRHSSLLPSHGALATALVLLESSLLGVSGGQKGLQEMVENREWRGIRKPSENSITAFLSHVSVLSNTQSITRSPIKLGSFAAGYFS